MFWYLMVLAVLTLLALVERDRDWPGIIAALILGIMCSLRYETGFDWVEYEYHYFLAPALGQPALYVQPITEDIGFEFLNRLLKYLNADFQWLMFITGAFNMLVLYLFSRKFSPLVVIVLIWYYGFCFLYGQMAMMRQSLSISFIYLAIMRRNDGYTAQSIALCLCAALFHIASLLFAIIPFAIARPLKAWMVISLAAVGFFASLIKGNFIIILANLGINSVVGGLVGEKFQIYSSYLGGTISTASLALTLFHLSFIIFVERHNDDSYLTRVACWAAIENIIFHSWFSPFQILWNRMMLISIPLEIIVVCRIYYVPLGDLLNRVSLAVGSSVAALAALIYAFSDSQSLVYRPYQNLAVTWIRGPYGNGRTRYQIVRDENDFIFEQQKVR